LPYSATFGLPTGFIISKIEKEKLNFGRGSDGIKSDNYINSTQYQLLISSDRVFKQKTTIVFLIFRQFQSPPQPQTQTTQIINSTKAKINSSPTKKLYKACNDYSHLRAEIKVSLLLPTYKINKYSPQIIANWPTDSIVDNSAKHNYYPNSQICEFTLVNTNKVLSQLHLSSTVRAQ
jgi:hypothetical protein